MLDRHDSLRALITAELDEIKDPCSLAAGTPFGLAEMGLVDEIAISDAGEVLVKLKLTSPFCHMIGFFTQEATRRIGALSGVTTVELQGDAGLDWLPSRMSPAATARRQLHVQRMASNVS